MIPLLFAYRKQAAAALAAVLLIGLAWFGYGKYTAYRTKKLQSAIAEQVEVHKKKADEFKAAGDVLRGQLSEALKEKEAKDARARRAEATVAQLRIEVVERPKAATAECQAQIDGLYDTFTLREKTLTAAFDDEHLARLSAERALDLSRQETGAVRAENNELRIANDSYKDMVKGLVTRAEVAETSAKRWKIGALSVGFTALGGAAANYVRR